MQVEIQVLLALTVASETFCRTVTLRDPKVVSPCDNAARTIKDNFTASVLGRELVPRNAPADWSGLMDVAVFWHSKSHFEVRCSTVYEKSKCTGPDSGVCITCVTRGDEIVFNIHLILDIFDSKGILRMEWWQKNKTILYSDRNYTLPEIVDDSNCNLTLTVHGPSQLRTDKLCHFSKEVNTANIFQLCCQSRVTPCYAQIMFGGTVVAKDGAPCVTYVPTSNSTASMVLKFSLCSKTDYRLGDRCSMKSGALTTMRTTASVATTRRLTTIRTTARAGTTRETDAGFSPVTSVTGPETSPIDGDAGPETSPIDGGEATTDDHTLKTSTSVPVASSSNVAVFFWIAICIATVIALIVIIAYWMTHRKITETQEQKPSVREAIKTPEPTEPTQTKELEENVSEEVISLESESAVD